MARRRRARPQSADERRRACEAKTRYPSGKVAAREAGRFGMDFYPCLQCGGWHLTRTAL